MLSSIRIQKWSAEAAISGRPANSKMPVSGLGGRIKYRETEENIYEE